MDWPAYVMPPMAEPMEDIEDDEDFYGSEQNQINGNGHMQTAAGATALEKSPANLVASSSPAQPKNDPPKTPKADEQKTTEQQKRLDTLRKRLLAKREASLRPNTPSKTPNRNEVPQTRCKSEQQEKHIEMENNATISTVEQPMNDDLGLESLLAEGKAAAEAKVVRDNEAAATATALAADANKHKKSLGKLMPTIETRNDDGGPVISRERQPDSTNPVHPSPPKPADTTQSNIQTNSHPKNLMDPYYDDLAIWLEFTGYHDVPFRNSKLSTYKERRALEQEAARIAQKLEQLKKAEMADLESLRATVAHPNTASHTLLPPFPKNMPEGDYRNNTRGLKRPHSPEPPISEKASRKHNALAGFRIRGANEVNTVPPREDDSPSHRRGSLPERRRSIDDRYERDPSLERRQKNYRAGDRSGNYPSREGPRPFNARDREREHDDRSGSSAVNRTGGPQSGLDLHKGGVRYFMIKSWNHENVAQAKQDGLWATQEKNEALLTEAFHTSRHVILLFSVNRSMAFQGYALMTSPPDPHLPNPSFCNKLNWATSPAFSLRWFATTAVHFRFVGHLKNTCNPDEQGLPHAVLVGKDGQEISQDAGLGVVRILDEAEEVQNRGRLREERE